MQEAFVETSTLHGQVKWAPGNPLPTLSSGTENLENDWGLHLQSSSGRDGWSWKYSKQCKDTLPRVKKKQVDFHCSLQITLKSICSLLHASGHQTRFVSFLWLLSYLGSQNELSCLKCSNSGKQASCTMNVSQPSDYLSLLRACLG